jgi:MFS family permease
VEHFGLASSFYGCAVFVLAGLVVSGSLPISHASVKQSWWSGARALISDRRWLPFLFVVLLAGIAMSVVHSYLFLYMDGLGATGSLMGLALLVATLGEIGILGFSDRLLIHLGTRKLLMLGLAAHALRALLYALIRMPWLVLPIQLLHGLSFSAIWVASVSYASRLAPEGMGATAQGLFGSVMSGLGTALGSLSGGVLYERLGFSVMFSVSAAWALIGLALLVPAVRSRGAARRGSMDGLST